jgi:hypothetical protein
MHRISKTLIIMLLGITAVLAAYAVYVRNQQSHADVGTKQVEIGAAWFDITGTGRIADYTISRNGSVVQTGSFTKATADEHSTAASVALPIASDYKVQVTNIQTPYTLERLVGYSESTTNGSIDLDLTTDVRAFVTANFEAPIVRTSYIKATIKMDQGDFMPGRIGYFLIASGSNTIISSNFDTKCAPGCLSVQSAALSAGVTYPVSMSLINPNYDISHPATVTTEADKTTEVIFIAKRRNPDAGHVKILAVPEAGTELSGTLFTFRWMARYTPTSSDGFTVTEASLAAGQSRVLDRPYPTTEHRLIIENVQGSNVLTDPGVANNKLIKDITLRDGETIEVPITVRGAKIATNTTPASNDTGSNSKTAANTTSTKTTTKPSTKTNSKTSPKASAKSSTTKIVPNTSPTAAVVAAVSSPLAIASPEATKASISLTVDPTAIKVNDATVNLRKLYRLNTEQLVLRGATVPGASVVVAIHSKVVSFKTTADQEGKWSVSIPATVVQEGKHSISVAYEKDGVETGEQRVMTLEKPGYMMWVSIILGAIIFIGVIVIVWRLIATRKRQVSTQTVVE